MKSYDKYFTGPTKQAGENETKYPWKDNISSARTALYRLVALLFFTK